MVHRAWDIPQAAVNREPQDLTALGVYSIDLALVTHLEQGFDVELVDEPSQGVRGGTS
jgi:hypothetical protein